MGYDYRLQDSFGLSRQNTLLVLWIPAYNTAMVYKVLARLNQNAERFYYGQMPFTSGQSFTTYAGGSTTSSQAGAFPSLSYTSINQAFTYTAPTMNGSQLSTSDTTDIWYVASTSPYNTELYEVRQDVTPHWMRAAVSIPSGVAQQGFQLSKVMGGVQTSPGGFGFRRGSLDVFHIPGVHYGYMYGNDVNANVNTEVRFTYGEYNIEVPKDPNIIFDAIQSNIPARHVVLPAYGPDQLLQRALINDYGSTGFPITYYNQRTQALALYGPLIAAARAAGV